MTNMTIKRVGVFSLAKLYGATMGAMGVLVGAIYCLVFILGGMMTIGAGEFEGLLGFALGAGAIICFPIFYGGLGFIMGAIGALIFNLATGLLGGLELEVETSSEPDGL